MFLCPICGLKLTDSEQAYYCQNRHSFDRARSGYVNLLPANAKKAVYPGDSREMVASRVAFLELGHYAPLADKLVEVFSRNSGKNVLDAGCGSGYYADYLFCSEEFQKSEAVLCGVDISKFALEKAAVKNRQIRFAVASSFHLPFPAGCFELLYTVFAPAAPEEFFRVLGKGGRYLRVGAGKDHLYELKKVLYEVPRRNPDPEFLLDGFSPVSQDRLTYSFSVGGERAEQLYAMTPYCHTTAADAAKRLREVPAFSVTADFVLQVFQKK